jgi:hypothetical protein
VIERSGLFISELRLKGIEKKDAFVQFKKGANIVSGPSNTGKTFIFECIEYMLGKSSFERRIIESRDYQEIYLELEDYFGNPFTIKSDFEGGDFQKYECSIKEISSDAEYKPLKREHLPGKDNTLSSYILKKCNLNGSLIRTNANGKKRELSLRDLRILHLVDELRVPTKGSPFLTGQYTSLTAEESVLKLLLTGVDDAYIIESIPDKVLANKAGRLEILNEPIGIENSKLLEKSTKEEILSQEIKLNKSILKTKAQRDEIIDVFKNFDLKKNSLMTEIHKISIRKDELSKLYENTFIVEKQYISDIRRLKATIEAGSVLISHGEINCPICDSIIDKNVNGLVINVSESAKAELAKITGLLLELSKAKSLFKKELSHLDSLEESTIAELDKVKSKIDSGIKPKLEGLSNSIDNMQGKLHEIAILIKDYESLEYLVKQKEEVEKIIKDAPPKKRVFEKLTNSVLEKTAISMLKQKLDDSLIKSVTGLSQETIDKLKNKI